MIGRVAWRLVDVDHKIEFLNRRNMDIELLEWIVGKIADQMARARRNDDHVVDADRNLFTPVYGWFTEGFDTPDLKDAKALLEELS